MVWIIAQVTTPAVTIPAFTIPPIVITLIVATICGLGAQLLVGFTRGGCLAALIVGIVGALIGQWLATLLHMPAIFVVAGVDIVWTVIGSAILAALMALAFGGSRYRGPFRRGYRQ